ncbi:carboxypeptidase regulatory-like domain-containing protein [Olivibacter ginsenosidimutans]|uniref:Carboxypeptidase regulatory-like domain-containing protein n=1 Tax=Olivibacter ginsenosidimutans TaxID=1176537 RepID=A0ABP9BG04_9SPHI
MKKFLLSFILLLGVALVHAQVTTSSMSGTVLESDGQASIGASIKATHMPSGTVYGGSTNENGRFNLANMRVGGPYTVEVTYIGSKPAKYENIFLQLGQPYVLNVTLTGGVELDEVTVTAEGALNSKKTGVSTAISRKKIEEMPAISRSITDLTRMTPQANSQGDGFSFAGRNSLFNSLTLDGAQMNNVFGLSSLPGGQTGAQPFSLDAIEAIQINLSPYDVKQGGFTGAGVNAITKSGTNTFSGSVYTYYKNQDLQGYKVDGVDLPKNETYSNKQFGIRLGGPIIKDKLFFFVNGEITRRTTPGSNYLANRGTTGDNISNVLASDLDRVKEVLISKYNYDPGVYEGFDNDQHADNVTARIDWNIDTKHKLTLRYNYLNSYRDINPSGSNSGGNFRGPGTTSLFFSNMRYRQYNKINSITAELNSSFNSEMANNLQVVYSAFRDYRDIMGSNFPVVDINNGSSNYISFGAEPFSSLNALNQDIVTLTDNFNLFKGDHTLTFGGSVGYQKFSNAFAQFYSGQFRYDSVDDFIAAANGDNSVHPSLYQLTYSAIPGVARPYADFSMVPIAVYAQDEWFVKPNFKLSYGVRADVPIYTADIASNPLVTEMTFRDGEKLDVGQVPKTKILVSPRIGFNWDVTEDKSVVVRGGTGIFTGGVPGVWLTNQAGNTGLMFGNDYLTADPKTGRIVDRPFNPDPSAYIPANPTTPSTFAINATSRDFKMPQIWRSSLGVDYMLPYGILATLEGMYTKSINEVYHRDANLLNPAGQYSGTGDTRDYFQGGSDASRVNKNITNAIVLDNTSKGHAYNITLQLQKQFGKFGDAMVAYTHSDAKDITSSPGSQANSAYAGNAIVNDPNHPVIAYSSFVVRNRIVAAVNINFNITKNLPSKVGLYYEGRPYGDAYGDTRFNYVVSGDITNTGGRFSNSLMYVPKDRNDIVLVDITGDNPETADQQWTRLDAYINQDKYLSTRRGKYAERNGGEYPWMNRFDLRFMQELTGLIKGNNSHRLQASIDIINLGNLLNSKWGVTKVPSMTNFLQYKGAVDNTPTYTVNQNLGTTTFRNNTSIDSRYQIQLGLRYIFN